MVVHGLAAAASMIQPERFIAHRIVRRRWNTLQSGHAMIRLQGGLLICTSQGNLRSNGRMG
jgi:hypothetical protein